MFVLSEYIYIISSYFIFEEPFWLKQIQKEIIIIMNVLILKWINIHYSACIFFIVPFFFGSTFNYSYVYIKSHSQALCKLLTFCGFFFAHSSSLVMVIACATRFIALFFPLTALKLDAHNSVVRLVAATALLVALFNLHYFWNMTISAGLGHANYSNQSRLNLEELLNSSHMGAITNKDEFLLDIQSIDFTFVKVSKGVCEFRESSSQTWWYVMEQVFSFSFCKCLFKIE